MVQQVNATGGCKHMLVMCLALMANPAAGLIDEPTRRAGRKVGSMACLHQACVKVRIFPATEKHTSQWSDLLAVPAETAAVT